MERGAALSVQLGSETERVNPGSGGALLPAHIAVIMDGNGRWAKRKGLPRFEGHRRGVEAVRRTVRAAVEFGIGHLTIFSFSNENWRRPAAEVSELLGLLRRFLRNDLADLHEQGVKIVIIGEREGLAPDLVMLFAEAEEKTRFNTRLHLTVAFNYGGRQELIRAAQRFAQWQAQEGSDAPIGVESFNRFMDQPDLPDVDLLIRTSGEQRISNFLLWQAAYAELVFMDVLWPDFDKTHLQQAMAEFSRRDRRFGGVSPVVT